MISLLLASLLGFVFLFSGAYCFYRWGWRALYLFIPAAAAAVALGLLGGGGRGADNAAIMLSPLFIGATAAMSFRSGRSLEFFVLVSSLSLTLVFTGNYLFLKHARNTDLVAESRDRIVEIVKSSDIGESEKSEFLSRSDQALETLRDIVPFAYFLNSLAACLICWVTLRPLRARLAGPGAPEIKGLEHFRLSDYFIFVLIFGWLAVLLVDEKAYYPVYAIGLNCALILSVLYLMQAIGIAKFLLARKGLPRFLLPVGLLAVLFFGVEAALFVSIILASLGALDFWADFRKLEIHNKK